jgi:cytochrome b561
MPVTQYNLVSRTLHWAIVVLVIAQFSIAWTMPQIERGTLPVGLIAWHLSIGTTILAVMLVRLVWRLTHPAPPPPKDLSPALRVISRTTHYVLYAVLIALPIGGWVNASARGWPVKLFGAIPLPSLISKGSALGLAAGDIHMAVATALIVIIGLHIAGSAYHALVLKDDTVKRMV